MVLMELAAGEINKAQSYFALYAVRMCERFLIILLVWPLQHLRTKLQNTLP